MNVIPTCLGIALCLLGICLLYHRPPYVSRHFGTRSRLLMVLINFPFLELRYGTGILSFRSSRSVYGRVASHCTYAVRFFSKFFASSSHVPCPCLHRLDNGTLQRCLRLEWYGPTFTLTHKVASLYHPILDACITLHTHGGLVNVLGVLVVDVVLLSTMLVGLLRHAHRGSTGIWKLLYQQVSR